MKLSELLKNFPCEVKNFKDIEVKEFFDDSRKVEPDSIFFCIKGLKNDGRDYVKEAEKRGASVFVSDRPIHSSKTIVYVEDTLKAIHTLCQKRYGPFPFKKIGITGTNGKTTVAFLLKHFFDSAKEYFIKAGLISTLKISVGEKDIPNLYTTPPALYFYKTLAQFKEENVDYCIMEVTSHGLKQGRIGDIKFDFAIFTNLTQDHLDFHKTMEDYFESKKKLFLSLNKDGISIVNTDDPYGKNLFQEIKTEKLSYGFGENCNYRGLNYKFDKTGMHCEIQYIDRNGAFKIQTLYTPIIGKMNFYNILSAFSLLISSGFNVWDIVRSFAIFPGVPGRMEKIESKKGFSVYIDYAHTPDALEKSLITLRKLSPARLFVVFGAGGERDRMKRPLMGKVSASLADRVIITTDNPRFEEPLEIIKHIISGIDDKEKIEIIVNREDAIKYSIRNAREGDVILIAGKGHENYQEIKGEKIPFSDAEIVKRIMEE